MSLLWTAEYMWGSVSQPFGPQVPVKDKFSSYCPGKIFLRNCMCQVVYMFYVPKKHQVDADFAWIKVQTRLLLTTKFYNFSYIQVEISRFWDYM